MQLYTVKLANKHIVSVFDAKGKKTGEKTTIVEQVIRDLPYPTAQMYKNKDGDRCTVIKQTEQTGDRNYRANISTRTAKHTSPNVTSTQKKPTARPARETNIQRAAMTGDLSAAINQGE